MADQVSSLRTGIKYKNTPIGKVPVDWEISPLGKIAGLEYGASLPEQKREEGDNPVIGSSGVVGYHKEALIEAPGIIIGRKGNVGAINWADKDFYPIDTTFYISKNQSKKNLKWLFYLLTNLHLEKLNITTGVPGLNREEAHSIIVPIPPVSEQKKIGEILSSVDTAIEKTTQIIEKTEELKKGLMQRLFSEGIGHSPFKKTEFGTIPNISRKELESQKIVIPPFDEQQEIATILEQFDTDMRNQKDYKKLLEEAKKALMPVLLTGKLRVNLYSGRKFNRSQSKISSGFGGRDLCRPGYRRQEA